MNEQIEYINENFNISEDEDLDEAIPKREEFFTIDPFTQISQYNESLHSLDNNKIKYTEWVSTLQPYNFFLKLDKNQTPIMIDYDKMSSTDWTKVVSKVKPVVSNDIYVLYRRQTNISDIARYVNNDAFGRAMKEKGTLIFRYKNKEQLFKLSKTYGVIYPLGRYMNGSIRLAMCYDKNIKSVIEPDSIFLEMGKHKAGALEVQINYKVLRNHDKIEKWSQTPYFKDGKFFPTSPTTPLKI